MRAQNEERRDADFSLFAACSFDTGGLRLWPSALAEARPDRKGKLFWKGAVLTAEILQDVRLLPPDLPMPATRRLDGKSLWSALRDDAASPVESYYWSWHDEDAIRAADHVVDMGPGAGVHGGRVTAQGTPDEVARNPESLTGQYLGRALRIEVPRQRVRLQDLKEAQVLRIKGARGNNLKGVDVEIPVGLFTCVTGVSGSGKSTLVNDTLYAAVARKLYNSHAEPEAHDAIEGLEAFDKVINVDQSPIGRTPRSNPATYTGLFTHIRELMAEVPAARERGYGPGRFSFNVKGGRCETCEGDGAIKVEMHFLPDVYVSCHVCGGLRYNRETLSVRYKGKNIADVLAMTIEEAAGFFTNVPSIEKYLRVLVDVGLGYVTLGQSATTLSGGEAQRMKLSRELSKRPTGRTLYVLDEPSTGLHFQDISQLLSVLHRLVDQGNTILVIEHNLDILKHADYLIDLGPEGGSRGGEVIAQGTPEDVVRLGRGHTAKFLEPYVKPQHGRESPRIQPSEKNKPS